MVKGVVTQVNVIVASTTLVLTSFTGVAGVVLGTGIAHVHDDAGSVSSAVAAAIVLTSDFEFLTTHSCWTRWAFTLAQVLIPAIVAVAFTAVGV